jgi:glycerol kinase
MAAETGVSTAQNPASASPGAASAAEALRVDGGASVNDLLMQLQADQLQRAVERPVIAETTALGAASLAGLATGVWSSRQELTAAWQLDRRFTPGPRDDAAHARWRDAVGRTTGWS